MVNKKKTPETFSSQCRRSLEKKFAARYFRRGGDPGRSGAFRESPARGSPGAIGPARPGAALRAHRVNFPFMCKAAGPPRRGRRAGRRVSGDRARGDWSGMERLSRIVVGLNLLPFVPVKRTLRRASRRTIPFRGPPLVPQSAQFAQNPQGSAARRLVRAGEPRGPGRAPRKRGGALGGVGRDRRRVGADRIAPASARATGASAAARPRIEPPVGRARPPARAATGRPGALVAMTGREVGRGPPGRSPPRAGPPSPPRRLGKRRGAAGKRSGKAARRA